MISSVALIMALGMLLRSVLFDVVQKKFQMVTWVCFSAAQLLITIGADKAISGVVLMIAITLLCGMYYTRYSCEKSKKG